MNAGLDWSRDSADWPHREASRFALAGGLRWHVQLWPTALHPADAGLRQAQSEREGESSFPAVHPEPVEGLLHPTGELRQAQHEREGNGSPCSVPPEPVEGPAQPFRPRLPLVLLLHGTGASTHSWRDLAPLLSQHFRVLALDLPGHAFTGMPAAGAAAPQLSLPGMAQAVAQLLTALGEKPALIVGHSAGAAVAVRMALDGLAAPQLIVGLNAALLPLRGLAGQVFSPVAKLMAGSAWVPKLFARHASDPNVARRLLESTGSQLDERGLALYGRLVSNPGHAAGALAMMANWDLQTLADDLHRLHTPLALVVGTQDRTVRPSQAERVAGLLAAGQATRITRLPGLGHLAHEERPAEVAVLIERLFAAQRDGSNSA